uniref:Aldo/keto reductase n=1 Tax=Roseihalotalea indica TaxID=2867963 RepID=A0AA49GQ47_9BACT|nr:aldo/keto reductase [Tunicatimonas sp. TK19036]
MKKPDKPQPPLSRRDFLSRASASSVGLAGLSFSSSNPPQPVTPPRPVIKEWRNQQPGMAYRQLGRTGMMISEVVCGGDPIRLGNTRPVELAMEKGLNYLDMAPAYGNGECETAYSQVIDSPSKREKVFITTKVSGFSAVRDQLYKEIFDGLPSGKQEAIVKKAKEMRAERAVDKPGYYLTYWPGQDKSMDGAFISNAMMQDYGHRVEGSKAFREKIISSVEGSLKRTGFGYFDTLMCPHGANSPEEVQITKIYETIDQLKRDGKIRFLGVSTHNDPAGVLRAASASGQYDVAMCAYNIINGGYMEDAIRQAYEGGMGIIGMKVAMAVATHHKSLQPVPSWRVDKVERIVPGDMKAPMKAYLWALQNPHISAVISNLWDEQFVNENLSVVGKKVELQPG